MAQNEQAATWAEVQLEKLAANYAHLCAAAEGAEVMAVVKADAYGHGAAACGPRLVQAGAKWLGVTNADEGIVLRSALQDTGVAAKILLMRGLLPYEVAAAIEAQLTPVVWTAAHLDALETYAKESARLIAVHLEIDTGMSRQGANLSDLAELLERFSEDSLLRLEGVMTHFASSEEINSPQNDAQVRAFAQAVQQIAQAGLQPEWVHAGATSAVDAGVVLAQLHSIAASCGAKLMCRTGLGLYGYALPLTDGTSQVRSVLQPVLAWKTQVVAVKQVPAGARIGYNGLFTAPGPMRLALLPVGYADGLRRTLTDPAAVLIAGRRARILGRVSMDVTIVDVTSIPEAQAGSEAVIFGEQGGEGGLAVMTADEHARLTGTVSYEILCGIGARVRRVIV